MVSKIEFDHLINMVEIFSYDKGWCVGSGDHEGYDSACNSTVSARQNLREAFNHVFDQASELAVVLERVRNLREELANSKYDLEHIEILTRLDEALGVNNE